MPQITDALVEHLNDYQFDAITYVPYHWRTTLMRGRAAVVELAHEVARRLNTPVYHAFRARHYSAPQHTLNRNDRLKRSPQRFGIRKGFTLHDLKHWLIIDDVVTTGATVNGLAKLLKAQGARSVTIAALARTPKNR